MDTARNKAIVGCLCGAAAITLVAATSAATNVWWGQWGQNALHQGSVPVLGQTGSNILANVVYDPFTDEEQHGAYAAGDLLVHYQTPLVDGNDVFMEFKTGRFLNIKNWQVQTWGERKYSWVNGQLAQQWEITTDWKPVPFSADKDGPGWEPVYHAALTDAALYLPGFGGTIWKVNRTMDPSSDPHCMKQINPFSSLDPNTYTAGPLTADAAGNIYYNVMQLDGNAKDPWLVDVPNSWLVKVTADDQATAIPWATLVPRAPAATDQCTYRFATADLPWPPSPNAVAPTIACGSQRPPVNTAPAIGPDGTIYDISRASLNDYWGYLIAIRPNLTPKWTASLREKFLDGCNVQIPANGTPGGCRAGATTGIAPYDNLPGSGRVIDDNTAAPVVAPDGSIFYGAYTRYNYAQGHLMQFSKTGKYLGAYHFGWDTTPAIFRYTLPDGSSTYAVLTKDNQYGDVGSYCNDRKICPPDRTATNPTYPEQYFMTSLSPNLATSSLAVTELRVNWKWQNTNTLSCQRNVDGTLSCTSDHPFGFEWCINAPAVDASGTVFANSEDGNLYEIDGTGTLVQRVFTQLAIGAAYTPLSIGPDGKIYTQNDGRMFVIGDK